MKKLNNSGYIMAVILFAVLILFFIVFSTLILTMNNTFKLDNILKKNAIEAVQTTKAEGSVTLSETSGTVYVGNTITFIVSNATGEISCETNNSNIATCSISNNTVTVYGIAEGSATITVNVAQSTNYSATSKIYLVTVIQAKYDDGTDVYFNPVTGKICDEYILDNSTTGVKEGCLKWYIFNDNKSNDKLTLLLDHNTTAIVAWDSNVADGVAMNEVATSLKEDTSNWLAILNPRLITIDEVAHIVGADREDTIKFLSTKAYGKDDINTKIAWFYLDGSGTSYSTTDGWELKVANGKGTSKYPWLYDYTKVCTSHGCNIDDAATYGYWTSNILTDKEQAWMVRREGYASYSSVTTNNSYGVRPVITIDKQLVIDEEKSSEEGLLSITANGYSGIYDGKAHGITVMSSGATIKYGTSSGTYDLNESPKYTNAGTYTVYYEVTKEGYNKVTGSKQVIISKANGSATLSATSGIVYTDNIITFTVSNATGEISCKTNNSNIATCSLSGSTITIKGVSEGSATITVNVAQSTNYNDTSETYLVTVKPLIALSTSAKIGDYIKMTPTKTSYTIDISKTGATSTQTINPSELDLWRVIKVNSDGTIEMVSENASSVFVNFSNKAGYKNLVGYLNVLANQYQNTKYTIKARHMGYNGQTEYLTDTANTVDSSVTTPPWTCSTGESCSPVETKGGGDNLYTTDTNLVQNALGTLVASNKGSYWLASRYYLYSSANSVRWQYSGRSISSTGKMEYDLLYSCAGITSGGVIDGVFTVSESTNRIRPILTLKSGLKVVGSGTSSDPYTLE